MYIYILYKVCKIKQQKKPAKNIFEKAIFYVKGWPDWYLHIYFRIFSLAKFCGGSNSNL